MRVLSINRVAERPAGANGVLATFDAEVAPGICIHRLILKRNQSGDLRVFGPRVGAGAVAFFTPELATELTSLATAELERLKPYVHAA